MIRGALVFLVALAFGAFPAGASDRVALLIGNNQYATAPLRNAVNDARDLAAALRELGFSVILRENASRRDMIESIREFGQALEGAQAALFFYAGHAMQLEDRNYLVPIDAAMGSGQDVALSSVEISQVFDRMDRARTRFNFIILDACRDKPFTSGFKASSFGLAPMSAPDGALIAYATAPGSVAAEGAGRNDIYTKHILRNIKAQDLPAEIMFKRAREGVERETRGLQTPWVSSSLKRDFSFNPTAHATPTPLQIAAPRPSQRARPGAEALRGREIAPGVRELSFADGSIYRGAVRGTTFHGKGEYVSKDFKYDGDWKDGLKEGRGVYVWRNGDRYEGSFAGDRPDGRGSYRFANGDSYEGAVKQGAISGRGVYVARNGDTFEGPFTNGKPDGVGVYRFSSGDRYEGEMSEGRIQGTGRYYSRNGDLIEGPFVDGKPHGIATYRFVNGDRYQGEIIHGALSGQGTYFYHSGLKYEGEVRDGRPAGRGIFWFLDGTRFEGVFDDGLAGATGELVKSDGTRLPARIVDGKPRLLNN